MPFLLDAIVVGVLLLGAEVFCAIEAHRQRGILAMNTIRETMLEGTKNE